MDLVEDQVARPALDLPSVIAARNMDGAVAAQITVVQAATRRSALAVVVEAHPPSPFRAMELAVAKVAQLASARHSETAARNTDGVVRLQGTVALAVIAHRAPVARWW